METNDNVGIAFRLYEAALGREPDPETLGYVAGLLDAGLSPLGLAQDLLASPELVQRFGDVSNLGFVTQLYDNALHREPDSTGLAYIAGKMDAGMSRAEVLLGFAQAPEFQQAVALAMPDGFDYVPTKIGTPGADQFTDDAVVRVFYGLGGIDTISMGSYSFHAFVTAGDPAQVTDYTGETYILHGIERLHLQDQTRALDTGIDGHAGQAYRLYHAALGRPPDAPGLAFQIAALDNGASWDQVAANFLASPEFTAKFGSVDALDDTQFLMLLHHNMVADPDPTTFAAQLWQLQHGASRGAVLAEVCESYPAVFDGDPQLDHGIVIGS
jgi:serralysin